ncbi:hypothetical protein GTA08_BOTSDO05354 [Neofusicoccum parvum]|uniref:Uncharacterized protein n=1 Tax=Neofusicoccum parvum TaxID=310453 RepID=A0ACB5SJ97_9PEZI|nr:hypothetical protein GTA08_BOTSDO05354 [Neofusicoccum parvum]GME65535.1 hypothetical protein GTA08_BOTSDO05354 [Neofusicoccum parvum]
MYKPRSLWECGFLGTVAIQAAVITILEVFMLVRYQHWVNPQAYEITRAYTIPLNVGLFVFGCWWQLLLSTEAVSAKNNLQLFALCICNGCLFAVNAMRYEQTSDTATEMLTGADAGVGAEPLVDSSYSYWPVVKPALITSTAWVGVSTLSMCGFAYRLHRDFAWEIYKHVSANVDLRSRYLAYQVFLVLMKLGVYFFIAFLVLYGVINVHYAMPEFGIVMALIPAALLQISLAVWCVRKEIYVGMAFVIILFCAASAYLFSRIAAMFGSGARAQTLLKDEMVLFAMVAFCFVFATLCTAIKCTINFKHGLKPIFERQEGLQKLQDEDSYRLDVILRTNGSTDMLKSKRFTLD